MFKYFILNFNKRYWFAGNIYIKIIFFLVWNEFLNYNNILFISFGIEMVTFICRTRSSSS